jgi:hypothetical protein
MAQRETTDGYGQDPLDDTEDFYALDRRLFRGEKEKLGDNARIAYAALCEKWKVAARLNKVKGGEEMTLSMSKREISAAAGVPGYLVRATMRELIDAGLLLDYPMSGAATRYRVILLETDEVRGYLWIPTSLIGELSSSALVVYSAIFALTEEIAKNELSKTVDLEILAKALGRTAQVMIPALEELLELGYMKKAVANGQVTWRICRGVFDV